MNDSSTQIIEMIEEDLQEQKPEYQSQGQNFREDIENLQTPMINPEEEAAVRRTEIQIFETPQEIPQTPGKFILVYFFLVFASDLIIQIGTGMFIVYAYSGPELDFTMMTRFLIVCHVLKILMNLFYFFVFGQRLPEFKKAYLMDILLSSSMLVIYWTITNFLLGIIPASTLKYMALVTMMLSYLRLHLSNKINPPYVPGKSYYFYESIQMLVVFFKLENPANCISWNLSFGFYWLLTVVLFFAAIFLLGLIVALIVASCLRNQNVVQIPRKFFLGIIGIAFYTLCNCVFFILTFLGFKFLMEEGKIYPHQSTEDADRLLYYVGIMQTIVSAINLINLTVLFIFLRKSLLEYIYQNKSGEISMQAFSTNLKMNLTQVSGSYFKTGVHDDENLDTQSILEQCLICNDKETEVVINPCGHSCFCESCAKKYLQEKNMCPMCRTPIDKMYLICQNPDTKEIMARGVINIKNKN